MELVALVKHDCPTCDQRWRPPPPPVAPGPRAGSALASCASGGSRTRWRRSTTAALTDGLPVVPPTPERVVAMLEHSARDPQNVVAVLPLYGGIATVEKVAVNAVMAGCADGSPAKVGFSFAERLDAGAPFGGLAQDRAGLAAEETGVTAFAGEAPRLVADQLARDPKSLAASLAATR
jgi:hypothetical protein